MPPSTLESANAEDFLNVYNTNVVGPLQLTQAFQPLLKKAAEANKEKAMSWNKAAVINVSTLLGSIERTPELFVYFPVLSYRCSKAALNMLTQCQSLGYKNDGILFTALHPGWVQTDLGGKDADLTVEQSVKGILKVLSNLSEKSTGILISWEGNIIPW
ncbi:Hypothetical predicted protein [Pelobates cultripes]|uniref:C-factor n=1 Tax=Pelobates cultripes TaxID=61616 RepID=A0AAD1THX8_PELCU|nr:Hypothetical predicted protein [Pelobates cultripes]